MKCGYKWKAPYLLPPPSKKVTSIGQECAEPQGHEGPHRSLTNVTKSA